MSDNTGFFLRCCIEGQEYDPIQLIKELQKFRNNSVPLHVMQKLEADKNAEEAERRRLEKELAELKREISEVLDAEMEVEKEGKISLQELRKRLKL